MPVAPLSRVLHNSVPKGKHGGLRAAALRGVWVAGMPTQPARRLGGGMGLSSAGSTPSSPTHPALSRGVSPQAGDSSAPDPHLYLCGRPTRAQAPELLSRREDAPAPAQPGTAQGVAAGCGAWGLPRAAAAHPARAPGRVPSPAGEWGPRDRQSGPCAPGRWAGGTRRRRRPSVMGAAGPAGPCSPPRCPSVHPHSPATPVQLGALPQRGHVQGGGWRVPLQLPLPLHRQALRDRCAAAGAAGRRGAWGGRAHVTPRTILTQRGLCFQGNRTRAPPAPVTTEAPAFTILANTSVTVPPASPGGTVR